MGMPTTIAALLLSMTTVCLRQLLPVGGATKAVYTKYHGLKTIFNLCLHQLVIVGGQRRNLCPEVHISHGTGLVQTTSCFIQYQALLH